MRRPLRAAAWCSLILLTACATVDDRLEAAATREGEVKATRALPTFPGDCRYRERSGVRAGEPLDVALIRTDQALGRANDRVSRCAGWYDDIKTGFGGGQ
ncbi:hypothetical protein IWQ55_006598 [Labrenzia sp. EL_208]|nr:hypothetical protein [Labrenzia sp. EL_208]